MTLIDKIKNEHTHYILTSQLPKGNPIFMILLNIVKLNQSYLNFQRHSNDNNEQKMYNNLHTT